MFGLSESDVSAFLCHENGDKQRLIFNVSGTFKAIKICMYNSLSVHSWKAASID